MTGMTTLAILALTTVVAAGIAALAYWLLLRATFQLMQPAARPAMAQIPRPQLVAGTRQLIRAYGVRP